ncbi:MAG: hypothetical protein SFX18_16645 [Pirellulales bacterium]|nr:hypothetical protein [Pirellulales bacterium]
MAKKSLFLLLAPLLRFSRDQVISVAWLLAVVFILGLIGIADSPLCLAVEAPPAQHELPETLLQHEFSDPAGEKHQLARWSGDVVVLFFLGTECPVANTYIPEIHALAEKFSPESLATEKPVNGADAAKNPIKLPIRWVGVHSDPTVTGEAAAQHAQDFRWKSPVLLDSEQTLAAALGAKVLGQVVVLHKGQILYRGRIDDRFSTNGKRRSTPSQRDLENLLGALAADKQVAFQETAAYGCPIFSQRKPPILPKNSSTEVK